MALLLLPLLSPLEGRIEKDPSKLDIRSIVTSEIDLLRYYKEKAMN